MFPVPCTKLDAGLGFRTDPAENLLDDPVFAKLGRHIPCVVEEWGASEVCVHWLG